MHVSKELANKYVLLSDSLDSLPHSKSSVHPTLRRVVSPSNQEYTECDCNLPYVSDGNGGSTLPTSPKARARRLLSTKVQSWFAECPVKGEMICSIQGIRECIDPIPNLE